MSLRFSIDLDPVYVFPRAGYEYKAEKEFIKRVGRDRFHAIITGFREIDLHYDKTIAGGPRKTYHSSPPKDIVIKEAKRIRKIT